MAVFLVPLWWVLNGIIALAIFWGGVKVGDKVWFWEDDDGDPWTIPLIPDVAKGLGAILLIGGLVVVAVVLGGRK